MGPWKRYIFKIFIFRGPKTGHWLIFEVSNFGLVPSKVSIFYDSGSIWAKKSQKWIFLEPFKFKISENFKGILWNNSIFSIFEFNCYLNLGWWSFRNYDINIIEITHSLKFDIEFLNFCSIIQNSWVHNSKNIQFWPKWFWIRISIIDAHQIIENDKFLRSLLSKLPDS